MIGKKTYRKYMRRIKVLMDLDPPAHTKDGKELLRLAKKVEVYEKQHYPLDHSRRKLRGDM